MGKNADLNASKFEGDDPRNSQRNKDRQERRKISKLTLDEFTDGYEAPPNDDAYFDFRSPPDDWLSEASKHSSPHLFKHSYCLAEQDKNLDDYKKLRNRLEGLAENPNVPEPIQDAITTWLAKRPIFALDRVSTSKGKHHWNAWDKPTHRQFVGLSSKRYHMPASVIWVIFSIKSMATSKLASVRTKKLLKRVVEEWDRWLGQEVDDFRDFLATLTHWDTGTGV